MKNLSTKLLGTTTTFLALTLTLQALDANPASAKSVQTADLTNCSEFVGFNPVPLDLVKNLVPQSYTISGANTNQGTLVVRASQCQGLSVGNSVAQPEVLVQIGVNLVSPDGTGDLNFYKLWFATNNSTLANTLQQTGLNTQYIPALTYNFAYDNTGIGGNLDVNLPLPANQPLTLNGYESGPPATDPGFFYIVNWWQSTQNTTIKMNATATNFRAGNSAVTLSTDPNSDLGKLIGGSSTTFATLSKRGIFDQSHLDLIVTPIPEPSFGLCTVPAILWMGFLLRLQMRRSKQQEQVSSKDAQAAS